jgi:hypothetical protein
MRIRYIIFQENYFICRVYTLFHYLNCIGQCLPC